MWAAAWWGMWETRASRELPLLVWSFMVRLGGSSGKKGAFINVFRVIMFFGQDQPGSEGRRHAHPGIKLPPACPMLLAGAMVAIASLVCG